MKTLSNNNCFKRTNCDSSLSKSRRRTEKVPGNLHVFIGSWPREGGLGPGHTGNNRIIITSGFCGCHGYQGKSGKFERQSGAAENRKQASLFRCRLFCSQFAAERRELLRCFCRCVFRFFPCCSEMKWTDQLEAALMTLRWCSERDTEEKMVQKRLSRVQPKLYKRDILKKFSTAPASRESSPAQTYNHFRGSVIFAAANIFECDRRPNSSTSIPLVIIIRLFPV